MNIKKLKIVLPVIILLFFSCVSSKQFNELKDTYTEQINAKDNRIKELESKLFECVENKNKCLKESAELSILNKKTEKEKIEFSDKYDDIKLKLEDFKLELKKQRSIVQLQDNVIKQVNDTKKQIETSLKEQIATQEIKIDEMKGRLKVTFVDKILFDSGSAEINKRGKELLIEVSKSLKENKFHNIKIEGHTDDVPISSKLKSLFPTNWELSTARATAVLRHLQDFGGLDPLRLSATGYSYYKPVDSNDTPEGRSQNRRIEIILIPAD